MHFAVKKEGNSLKNAIIGAQYEQDREELWKVVPLASPFALLLDVCNLCNFKCRFCSFHHKGAELTFPKMSMKLAQAQKLIDDIASFGRPLKMLRIVGGGEPLLNHELSEIIAYAKKKKITNHIEMLTNGSLLSPELNRRLVDSGLDRLRVSIEGISAEQYQDIAEVKLNWEMFLNNLRDFYEHKGSCEVYIKIMDVAVPTEAQQNMFYSIFGSLCDQLGIEYVMPTYDGIEREFTIGSAKGLHGNPVSRQVSVCPFPFYSIMVSPDGMVTPCCADWKRDIVLGNAFEESIVSIWNGSHRAFLERMVKNGRQGCRACVECFFPERTALDSLDEHKEELMQQFQLK